MKTIATILLLIIAVNMQAQSDIYGKNITAKDTIKAKYIKPVAVTSYPASPSINMIINKRTGGMDTLKYWTGTIWEEVIGGGITQPLDTLQLNDYTPTAPASGTMYFDNDVLNIRTTKANNTMQVGQEFWTPYMRNNTGAIIPDGKVVYLSGHLGNQATIAKARSDNAATCGTTLGLTTHDCAINQTTCLVTTMGYVSDINTSAWDEGDTLYISQTTAGEMTNVRPTAGFVIRVGFVKYSHASNGQILVHISNESPIYWDGQIYNRTITGDSLYLTKKRITDAIPVARTAGDANVGYIKYNGVTSATGQFYGYNSTTLGFTGNTYTSGNITSASGVVGKTVTSDITSGSGGFRVYAFSGYTDNPFIYTIGTTDIIKFDYTGKGTFNGGLYVPATTSIYGGLTIDNTTYANIALNHNSTINPAVKINVNGNNATVGGILITSGQVTPDIRLTKGSITDGYFLLCDTSTGITKAYIDKKGGGYFADGIDAGSTTNYTEVNALGQLKLVGKAKAWNDIAIMGFALGSAAAAPVFTTGWAGSSAIGANYFQGTSSNDIAYFNIQVPHNTGVNDSLNIHIHGGPTTTPGATDSIVFRLTRSYAEIGATFPAVTQTRVVIALNGLAQWSHNAHTLLTLTTGTGNGLSGTYNCSIERLQNDASDTYAQNWGLLSIDAHAKIESFGSRYLNAK